MHVCGIGVDFLLWFSRSHRKIHAGPEGVIFVQHHLQWEL